MSAIDPGHNDFFCRQIDFERISLAGFETRHMRAVRVVGGLQHVTQEDDVVLLKVRMECESVDARHVFNVGLEVCRQVSFRDIGRIRERPDFAVEFQDQHAVCAWHCDQVDGALKRQLWKNTLGQVRQRRFRSADYARRCPRNTFFNAKGTVVGLEFLCACGRDQENEQGRSHCDSL